MMLTAEELSDLTGRSRRDAQIRVLRFMGVEHRVRPDGTLAVLKSHVEQVLGGHVRYKLKDPEPNWSAI